MTIVRDSNAMLQVTVATVKGRLCHASIYCLYCKGGLCHASVYCVTTVREDYAIPL